MSLDRNVLLLNHANHASESLNLFPIPFPCFFILVNFLLLLFAHIGPLSGLPDQLLILILQLLVPFFHDLELELFLFVDMQRSRRLRFLKFTALFHGRSSNIDSGFWVETAFGEALLLEQVADFSRVPVLHAIISSKKNSFYLQTLFYCLLEILKLICVNLAKD